MVRRLKLPETLVVAVLGASALVLPACDGDDDDQPQQCDVEGICPDDGRVCLDEQSAEPCCPVCPEDGMQCPAGCILEFPPI
jgi:hypothetical protein